MFDLTSDDIRTILAFLARTDLKGQEAPAFMNIVSKLQRAVTDKTDKPQMNTVKE